MNALGMRITSEINEGSVIYSKSQPLINIQGVVLTMKEHPDFKEKMSLEGASNLGIINDADWSKPLQLTINPPVDNATVLMGSGDHVVAVQLPASLITAAAVAAGPVSTSGTLGPTVFTNSEPNRWILNPK
jgi:hypothetical protein